MRIISIRDCRQAIVSLLGMMMLSTWPAGGYGAPLEADRALDFARALYEAGDFQPAIGEAKRFIYYFPDDPRVIQARGLIRTSETAMKASPPRNMGREPSWAGRLLIALVNFYREHLATFRPPKSVCPSYPPCSAYAVEAIKKHGAALGAFIYIDRFWREVSTAGKPPFVLIRGENYHWDPLELNDYWLDRRSRPW